MDKYHLTLGLVLFFFGIFAKYADLFNEHGLREPFKFASLLSGIIWGVCGVIGTIISPFAGITYIAHVLYWFQRVKLEFTNHATAGVLIVLGGIYFQGEFLIAHKLDLLILFLAYTITGHLNTRLKKYCPNLKLILRLRLRIYLIPIAYAYYYGNIEPALATIAGMLGTEIITIIYREYSDDVAPKTLTHSH